MEDESKLEEVYRLINAGMTQKDSCEQVGVSVMTYNRWLKKSPDIVVLTKLNNKKDLEIDLLRIKEVHRKVAEEIVKRSSNTKEMEDKDLFAYETKLSAMISNMSKELGVNLDNKLSTPQNDAARKYLESLRGPNLRPGTTVITQRETTIEIIENAEKEPDIIDAEFT